VIVKRTTSWLKRLLLIALAALLAAAIIRAWLPKPVEVETAVVEAGPLKVTINEAGQAKLKDRYVVSAPLSGSIARIELEPGDEVERGQEIARILPALSPLLDERSRKSAQARVAAALAAQKQSTAQIERAKASLEFVQVDATRSKLLFEKGTVPRQELEQALLRQRTAQAELDSARFGSRVADHELDMARAALRHLTGTGPGQGEQLEVPAPVAGRVLRVMQQSEGVVQAGQPLLELGDPAALEIVVDVLTSDAVRTKPGASVTLDRWGGTPIEGRVARVEPSAFTRISALGVEEQRVNVRIDLIEPRAKWAALGDGYRVEAQIVVWESDAVVTVPTSAVFRSAGEWTLYVVDDDRARLTRIELGESTPRQVQVLSGLEPGRRVVIHPSDRVRDGVKVAPR
jgi:HlyD family secretion protein